QAADALAALDRETQDLDRQRQEADRAYQAERGRHVEAEVRRRQAELGDQEAALLQEQRLLQDKWHLDCQGLESGTARPAGIAPAAAEEAGGACRRRRDVEGQRGASARRWAACLEEAAGPPPARLPGYVNLVAATTAGLAADPHFGEASSQSHGAPFDLLVLEEADQVTESEFLKAARRARHWVLVGEAGDPAAARQAQAPPAA